MPRLNSTSLDDPRNLNQPGRRDFLRLGGLVAAGAVSGWSCLPRAEATTLGEAKPGKARSLILVYLLGGPPHLDMWDMKPNAPAEIRGPFRPIATRAPGMQICEHLPRLAGVADKFSLLRGVSCPNNEHTSMMYYTLTGHLRDNDNVEDTTPPRRTDFPHIGSVVARLRPSTGAAPGFVALPEVMTRQNDFQLKAAIPLRGGRGGFFGTACDPLTINRDPRSPDAFPAVTPPKGVSPERFRVRRSLLAVMDSRRPDSQATRSFDELRQMAVHVTGNATNGQGPYTLEREPATLRERYGLHRFGQSLLLARRLVEAGVPMVAIHFNHMSSADAWDMHGHGRGSSLDDMKKEMFPLLDQGLSALLEDLHQRGRLEDTAVACMGEFGRTPKVNQWAGRDHWGSCMSVLLAGGGIQGGRIHGASDKTGGYPSEGKVEPPDIHATLYHCLGINPGQEIHDLANRPHQLCTGKLIDALL
jgi:hypothetical protein